MIGIRKTVLLALLALVVLFGALPAAAQTTTGQIRGRVTDENGNALPAATVSAVNTATGLRRTTTTDPQGVYTIRLLPPGNYNVEASSVGRAPAVSNGLRVALGEATTANLTLAMTAVQIEGVTVTADQSIVDATTGGVKQLVGRDQIETLPSLGRNFTDFINLSGMVAPTPETTTGGRFSIAGARPSQTTIQIDGVDANNSFFGGARGGSRIPFVFSLESIQEFQVIPNGYDVEYGNYAGGVVNVVTQSGTNDFKANVYTNYRSAALTAHGFGGEAAADYKVQQYAAKVAGPVVKDKLFYLFSVDGQRRREPQVPVSPEYYRGVDDPASADSLAAFIDILQNRYGVTNAASTYQPFTTSDDAITLFGRADWNINDKHRLTLRDNYSHFVNGNEFNPVFDFNTGRSVAENYRDNSNSLVGELNSVLGAKTFNVLRAQYSTEHNPRTGNDLRPELGVDLGTGQRAYYGGTFASFQNDLKEDKYEVIDNLTHVIGDHTLKVGAQAMRTVNTNRFLLNGSGSYFFPSLDAFRNMQPSSFQRNIRSVGGVVPTAKFSVMEWAAYLQDEWHVTPKLTATGGLRYDAERFNDDPGRVIEAERAFGIKTGIAPVDDGNVSPRLALAYDMKGDGSSVVRAGAGYFYGRVPYVLGGNVLQTEEPVLTLTCNGGLGDPNAPPSTQDYGSLPISGADNPTTCAGTNELTGVPTYTFWSNDFQYPETFKANVGYEQRFGSRTTASLDVIYSAGRNFYTVQNINLRPAQFVLADEGGRRVFQPASGFSPTASGQTAQYLNTEMSNVFVNYTDGLSRGLTASVKLAQQLGERSQVQVSYTYSTAYDNSSYSCCTASEGWSNDVGAYGPNAYGGVGDEAYMWGPSDYVRNHTFILSGNTELPWGFRVSAFWRAESGRRFTPIAYGDVNGDGNKANDRPFVFAPEDLPLAATGEAADQARALYASYLKDHDCVGDYVGQILPRNTCTFPWYNRLDMQLTKTFHTVGDQRAEFQVDFFNVLNGLNSDWGRYMGIYSANGDLLTAKSYDAATGKVLYDVPKNFYTPTPVAANLNLQFQAQLGFRYYF